MPERNILIEPSPRDSCAAIALANEVIERRAPGAIVGSFAADHLIREPQAFHDTVRAAVEGARHGRLMTIGITPAKPETGYGYLECSEALRPLTIQSVRTFREKPPLELASEYVASGRYLWNAGMFVWQARTFLAELQHRRADVAEPIRQIAAAWDSADSEAVLSEVWPTVAKVAVDYAVMEPAAADGLVSTVPGDFGWSDIGDFETIAEALGHAEQGSTVVEAAATESSLLSLDSDGLIVLPSSGRLVATLDVHDLIIVDVPDAVLICKRERAQDVKKLTELLRARGATAYV